MMPALDHLYELAQQQPTESTLTRILGGTFFGACALGALTVFLFLAYETIAVTTGVVPTISVIVGGWSSEHPIWTGVVCLMVGFAIGALVVHLTGWRP